MEPEYYGCQVPPSLCYMPWTYTLSLGHNGSRLVRSWTASLPHHSQCYSLLSGSYAVPGVTETPAESHACCYFQDLHMHRCRFRSILRPYSIRQLFQEQFLHHSGRLHNSQAPSHLLQQSVPIHRLRFCCFQPTVCHCSVCLSHLFPCRNSLLYAF